MRGLGRIAAPLAGAAAATVLLVQARGLDAVAREGQLGPGFWPRLVLAGLALACAAQLLAAWPRARPGDRAGGAEVAAGTLAAAVGLLVLYVLAMPVLGFALATAGFIAAFMAVAGGRAPVVVGASAALGTVVLLYVFVRLVYLPLPKGAGPFETITLALYRGLGIF